MISKFFELGLIAVQIGLALLPCMSVPNQGKIYVYIYIYTYVYEFENFCVQKLTKVNLKAKIIKLG